MLGHASVAAAAGLADAVQVRVLDGLFLWGFMGPPPEEYDDDDTVYLYTHRILSIAYNDNRVHLLPELCRAHGMPLAMEHSGCDTLQCRYLLWGCGWCTSGASSLSLMQHCQPASRCRIDCSPSFS